MSQAADVVPVLNPEGDILASGAESLKARIQDALRDNPGGLCIDLSGVAQIDSVGLGLLIATHNTLRENGGSLRLAGVPADIVRLLKAMRLDKHFLILD